MRTKLLAAILAVAFTLPACDTRTAQYQAPGPASAPPVAAAAKAELVTGFKECRKLFPGELPRVPDLQAKQPRDLCFDAFAVLHSGRSKTPIFVVEKLTAAQLADAADEERTNKFFADARLPQVERATLEDYRGSGYDRGHMQYPVDFVLKLGFASESV